MGGGRRSRASVGGDSGSVRETETASRVSANEVEVSYNGTPKRMVPRCYVLKGKTRECYESATLNMSTSGSFTVGVGDFVHLRTAGEDFYAGQVLDFFEERGNMAASVQWLYLSKDIQIPSVKFKQNEILYAKEYVNKISVVSIIETFRIEFEIATSSGKRIVKSALFVDKGRPDGLCLYTCSRYYDLTSSVHPMTEEMLERVQSVCARFRAASGVDDKPQTSVAKDDKGVKRSKVEVPSRTPSVENDESSQVDESDEDRSSATSNDDEYNNSKSAPDNKRRPALNGSARGRSRESQHHAEIEDDVSRRKKIRQADDVEDTSKRGKQGQPQEEVNEEYINSKKKKKSALRIVDDGQLATTMGSSNLRAETTVTTTTTTANNNKAKDETSLRLNNEGSIPLNFTRSEAPLVRDLDEKLWDIFQNLRNIIGSADALEVLGFMKLEYLVLNDDRPATDRIGPPPYIWARLEKVGARNLYDEARRLLHLGPLNLNSRPRNFANIAKSFMALESCRPGVIFGQLGLNVSDSSDDSWLFPRKQRNPIFGMMLGHDGFQTCRMVYQKQVLHVPINREGTIPQAAVAGFYKLVSKGFYFSLIRTGDFRFEVAPSPDEKCEQLFVKVPDPKVHDGRRISLHVPLKKAFLNFVKVLVAEQEGYPPDKQRYMVSGKYIGEDDDDFLPLAQFHIKPAAVLQLLIRD